MKKIISVCLILFCLMSAFCEGSNEKQTNTTKSQPKKSDVVTTVSQPAANVTTISSDNGPAADIELYKKTTIQKADVKKALEAYEKIGQKLEYTAYLDTLIENELILQQLEHDEVDMDKLFNNYVLNAATYYAQQFDVEFKSQEDVEKFFVEHGTTLNEFAASIYNQFETELVANYLETKYKEDFEKLPKIESSTVMDFFEDNKDIFVSSEKVKFAHIFIAFEEDNRTKEQSKTLADSIYSQIQNGSLTFEKGVTEYSNDKATSENGGVLGWMNLAETEFEKTVGIDTSEYHKMLFTEDTFNKIFTLEEGYVFGVLESVSGYHIVKVIKHNPQKILSVTDKIYPESDLTVFNFCESYVKQAQEAAALETCYAGLVEQLKSQAKITKY